MLKAIDLFTGAGGFLIGLKEAGYDVLFSCDIDKAACETHRQNFDSIPLIEGDIRDISDEQLKQLKREKIDLVVGGPPCQGFSMFGKRRFINTQGYDPKSDPRNALVYEYIRVVKEIKPKYFLMENVKGFVSLDNGEFVKEVINEFKKIGYDNIDYKVINAADYGVPQKRQRMIMIGNCIGQPVEFPVPTHSDKDEDNRLPYVTVGEAIMDLASLGQNDISNHIPLNHKPIVAERMGYIKEGCKLKVEDLPEHLNVVTRTDSQNKTISNYSHVYKRLSRQEPSTTMVPGHNAFPVHPTLNRTLTVREAARIQTFPDNHIFYGTRQQQCIQVGNAIPPKLAKILTDKIAQNIEKES